VTRPAGPLPLVFVLAAAACAHGPAVLEREPALAAIRPVPGPVPVAGSLSSGLPVLVVERPSSRLVSVSFVSRAGSAWEPASRAGEAALLLDLVQAGAAGRSATAIAAEAAALGSSLRGSVTPDSWRLGLTVLPAHLPEAAALLADVLLRPDLAPAELERLRDQRRAQLAERGQEAGWLAAAAAARALYGEGHPYGRPPEGNAATVGRLGPAELREAHARLGAAGAALVVVGPTRAAQVVAALEQAFGAWSPAPPVAPPALPAPSGPAPRLVLVDRPGAPQSALAVGQPGFARTRPDALALRVANNVLGGSFLSRLNANLRERNGWTYGARSAFDFRAGPGPFLVTTAVQTDATAPAVREVLAELAGIRAAPLLREELEKGKALLVAWLLNTLSQPEALVEEVARAWALGAPLDEMGTLLERAGRLDAAGVQAALAALRPGEMTVVVVGEAAQVREPVEALLGPARLVSAAALAGAEP